MRNFILILIEIAVILWLVVSVDYVGYLWAWLPAILYTPYFVKWVANKIDWEDILK